MRTYFETVIRFDVFHNYYSDNRCKALLFTPTDSCLAMLNRFHLIFKNIPAGFAVIGEKKNTGTEALPVLVPRIDIPVGTVFYFLISSLQTDFLNITDADMDKLAEGKKFYFKNTLAAPVVNSGIATFNIHNNLPIANALVYGSVNFHAPVKVTENPLKLVLRDVSGVVAVEKVVPRNAANVIISDHVLISDTSVPEGIYTLQQVNAGGVITSSQDYFLTNTTVTNNVEGILAIDYNQYLLQHADKEVRLEVRLQNRDIHWIYRIEIEKYTNPAEAPFTYVANNLFLNNNANNVPSVGSVFTRSITAPLDPADNFKVRFRSTNAIPLKEKPYQEVKLMNNATALIDNLPNPNPLMMKLNAGNYEAEVFLKIK
jgi:hypothetical protein